MIVKAGKRRIKALFTRYDVFLPQLAKGHVGA
jgi:hypothetical protein